MPPAPDLLPRSGVDRRRRAADLAVAHDGVVHRRTLREAGITRSMVRSEVRAGRWVVHGRFTVQPSTGLLPERARLWQAVWESGSGAALDGAAALVAAGMRGFQLDTVDVVLPANARPRPLTGVRVRQRRDPGPVLRAGLPRCRPEHAVLRAAAWARTDRMGVLLLCLAVQQRIVSPARLLLAWRGVLRTRRRRLLAQVVADLCDGAHSLGELDFARLCRARGLPPPTRQVVRTLPSGRVYLDVAWEDIGLVVEIDGGHHGAALHPVDDALRQNEVTLGQTCVLQIPVVGLRLREDAFMEQVVRGHRQLSERVRARGA